MVCYAEIWRFICGPKSHPPAGEAGTCDRKGIKEFSFIEELRDEL
jgi:hypothetical protein